MTATLACPSCGAALPRSVTERCPSCDLGLTGPQAQELWQVDQQLAVLQQRRSVLLAALSSPAEGAVTAGAEPAGAPGLAPPASPGPVAERPGPPRWAAQQVLLGVGALLVLVAAAVFVAVAWSTVGVAVQVAVMAVVTLAAGAGSLLLARRGLRASREALALLAVGLAVVDGVAAHQLDLAGLGGVDPSGYAAVATAALALVLVAVSPPVLSPSPASYRLVAVLAAAVAPVLALVALEPGLLAATATSAVVAALAGRGSRRLSGGWTRYRPLLTPVLGGYLVLTWTLGLAALLVQPLLGPGGLASAVALLAVVGAGRAAGLHRGLRHAARAHPLLARSALLAGAVHLVALSWQGDVGGLAVLAVVAAVTAALTAAKPAPGLREVVAAAALLVAVLAVVALAVLSPVDGEPGGAAACAAALAGACCAAALLAVVRPSVRLAAAGWSAAAGAATVAAATAPLGLTVAAGGLTAAAAVLVAVAARLAGRLERVLLAVATAAGLAAVGLAVSASPLSVGSGGTLPALALVLAALGLTALAYGVRPRRGAVAWLGVLLCSAGNAVRLVGADVAVVEAYALPLAGLALLVGLVRLRRQPDAPSWVTVGPAASAALLPSAFATVGDPALTRPVLVVVAAAAVMVLGIRRRWQAPFLSGALAACVVAASQLAPYAVGAPRWVSFGAVGIVLLVLGSRYEQRRQDASQAVHWVAALR